MAAVGSTAAAGAGGGGAGSGAAQASPLSAYPEDGALRPLAERLLLPGSGEEAAPQAGAPSKDAAPGAIEATSLLRVLTAAPRLPAAGWEPVCRRLLRRGAGGAAAAQVQLRLQLAALDLALTHAHVTALGFASLLDHLLMPTAFAQLPAPCRAALLRRLPDAVRCLPANRAGPLLQVLAGLAAGEGGAGDAADLAVSAWEGMRGMCAQLAAKDPAIVSKVRALGGHGAKARHIFCAV